MRFDPQNQQILRDLAVLQVQVRDLAGFIDTRSSLLNLKPQARTNWLALAVAHHLAGSHDVAAEVLRAYESTQEGPAGSKSGGGGGSGEGGESGDKKARLTPQQLSDAYEASELVLYRAVILREAGRPKDAIAWLDERRADVRDARGLAALEAWCLLEAAEAAAGASNAEEAASLRAKAAKAYRAMLRDNADDLDAHRGLRCALGLLPVGGGGGAASAAATGDEAADHGGAGGGGGGGAHEDALLTDSQRLELRKLYAALRAEHPRSGAVGRVPLDFEKGGTAEFSAVAEAYVRRPLERGVPSLFSDLRPLYADAAKAEALGKLMESLQAAVDSTGKLPALSAAAAAAAQGKADDEAAAALAASGAASGKNNTANAESSDSAEDPDVAPPPMPTGWLAAALKKGGNNNGNGEGEEEEEGGVKTWLLHYLTQHYDELGRTADALAASDAAMASSGGRVPELWLARARLLKRAGDAKGAAAAAARASALEPSDRYLNSMAARYLLSAGDVVTAQRAAGVFTRGSGGAAAEAAAASPDDPLSQLAAANAAAASLAEMQHSWFELREGEARLAENDYGRSLKHFRSVAAHFAEFVDDQLDFHQWCLRRSTLRQYVSLIRLADRVRAHPQHARAVWGAVRAYCALADAKAGAGAAGGGASGAANGKEGAAAGGKDGAAGGGSAASATLTAEERKKEQLRRKKEQKAAERAEAERKEQQQKQQAAAAAREASSSGGGGGGKQQRAAAAAAKPADPDPDGTKLAAVEDPMAEAAKLVQVLADHAPGRLITQRCAFETFLRRGKPVLALAAAERAAAIAGPRHPEAFRMVVRLALALCDGDGGGSSPCAAAAAKHAVVGQVVREGVARLLGDGGGGGGNGSEPLSRERVRNFVASYAQAADRPAPVPASSALRPAGNGVARPNPLDARAGRADDPRSSPLARRAAAAEMMALLCAGAASKGEALALLPLADLGKSLRPAATHSDCVAVHRLLLPENKGALADAEAADKWRAQAAGLFPWSGYFGGAKCSSGSGSGSGSGGANGNGVGKA